MTLSQRIETLVENAYGPEYRTAQRIAHEARRRAASLTPASAPTAPHPLTSGEITDDWINQTIEQEHAKALLEKQRNVLLSLGHEASGKATAIGSSSSTTTKILKGLQTELDALLADVGEISDELGTADTAAKAIAADKAALWKRLSECASDYTQLRQAQSGYISSQTRFYQRPANDYDYDDHASYTHLRNLDRVWPNWRSNLWGNSPASTGWNTGEPKGEPWPADPTELLLWLVRSDAQPWIPTEAQLATHQQQRTAAANPMPNVIPGRPDKKPPRDRVAHVLVNATEE